MGSDYRKHSCSLIRLYSRLKRDSSGDAVIEAAILFPVMTLIFAALVLISFYLPAQALLQWSTQYAATALAVESGDTWLSYNEQQMSFYLHTDRNSLPNVYAKLFEGNDAAAGDKGEIIAETVEDRTMSPKAGSLSVSCYLSNHLIYKEFTVEAMREYPMPVNLSIIGFPDTITVSASSTAVVQDGDEFIRNVDLATDFAQFLIEKFDLHDIAGAISSFGNQVKGLMGW